MDSSPYTKERKFHVVLDLETADNPVKIPPTSRKDHRLKFYVTTLLPSVGLHLSHESRNETCAWRVYHDSAGSPLAGGTVATSGHTRFMSPPRPPVHSVHLARLCAPSCPGPAPSAAPPSPRSCCSLARPGLPQGHTQRFVLGLR